MIDYSKRRMPTYTGPCIVCGDVFTAHYARRICDKCRPGAYRACQIANAKVQQAVKAGRLPSLPMDGVQCMDCEWPATTWDHRDYSKPLDVEPVCYMCNVRRGPGLRPNGVPAETLPSIARRLKLQSSG